MTLLSSVILAIDFIFPKVSKTHLAYASAIGMGMIGLQLIYFFASGVTGVLFGNMFVLDQFAIFFKIFLLFSTILILLSSINYLDRVRFFKGEYYYLLLFSVLGMMFMVSAHDLLSLYITLEFSTFGFYILVTYLREDMKSNEAGIKFFILGVLASSIIVFGISLIYGATGTILFSELSQRRLGAGGVVGLMFVFIGLAYKLGAVPFHTWVPDVYEGAPTPVTSFLSIVPKGAAFAVVLRLVFVTFGAMRSEWIWFVTGLSVLSMTYGNIVAIAQKNMKRLLAYSGIAQVGNLLIGLVPGTKMGGEASLFYLLAYVFANIGAFAVVIVASNATVGTVGEEMEDLAGLNRRSPFLAFSMLVFLLSLAGVPPLGGFVAKLYIFAAAMYQEMFFLVIVGLINVVISLYYYLVVVKKLYVSEPRETTPLSISWPMRWVVGISVAGVFILGIWPRPFVDLAISATSLFSQIPLR